VAEPIDSADITVAGDPALARDTAANALIARGFAVTWSDPWTGVATKGSKGKRAVFGAFTPYLEVGISVHSAENGSVVALSRPSTGMTGGLAGRAKARKNFATLTAEVTEVFRVNGVLIGSTPPSA
jgi:hypothetical protein